MSDTKTKAAEVSIRLATVADGPNCNKFHNEIYKKNRSVAQWEWEFANRADKDGTIPFAVAECDGKVVGTQALIDIEMIGPHGVFNSAKSEETLVSPSMRGQSLFTRMYEPLFDYVERHDIRAIWGFTPAGNAFRNVGFTIPAETSQIVRVFSTGAADALLPTEGKSGFRRTAFRVGETLLSAFGAAASWIARPRGHGLELKRLDRGPEWATGLSEEFIKQWGGCSVHRSTSYLQWRIFDNPYCEPHFVAAFDNGRPVGYVCYAISKGNVALIVDMIAVDAPTCDATVVTSALLDFAARHSKSLGAVAIRCWSVTPHPYDQLIRRVGRKQGWIFTRRGFGVVLREFKSAESSSPAFESWYVSRIFTEGTLG